MAIAFVKNVGTGTGSNSTTATITVPASGCAAGNTIVLRITTDADRTISSIVDSGGNTYTQWVSEVFNADDQWLYRSKLTTALVSGNTIVVTLTAKDTWRAIAEEFSGLDATENAENTATGTSATPSVSATPTNANNLIVAHLVVGSSGYVVTEDGDSAGGDTWHTLTKSARDCCAYKITTSAVAQTYNPTVNTSDAWGLQLGSLTAPPASLLWQPRSLVTAYQL